MAAEISFAISEKRRKVWAVEIDLYQKLFSVCQKYDLPIFAIGGTLLGAVRHNGFIPWDDDMDLIMLRTDYEKLCSVASNEFQKPYFFQNTYTDNFIRVHSQLRNSETTALLRWDYGAKYNRGIFIDIFVLDNWPSNIQIQKRIIKENKKLSSIIRFYNRNKSGTDATIKRALANCLFPLSHGIINLMGGSKKLFANYEKRIMKLCPQDSDYVSNVMFDDLTKDYFKKEWFSDTVMLPFMNISISCPIGFKNILEVEYGKNYMTPRMASSKHGEVFFDTEKSYKSYENLPLKNFKALFENNDL